MKRLIKKIRLWLIKKLHATPDEEVNKLIDSSNKISEQLRFYTNKFTKYEISSKIYAISFVETKDMILDKLISEIMCELRRMCLLAPLIEINTKQGTNGSPDEIIGKLTILRREGEECCDSNH